MKRTSDVLSASAAFLERCMEDERAEIIERLCASAAPAPIWGSEDVALRIRAHCEREDRIDLFECDYEVFGSVFRADDDDTDTSVDVRLGNVRMFPDLYGEWVYQPC